MDNFPFVPFVPFVSFVSFVLFSLSTLSPLSHNKKKTTNGRLKFCSYKRRALDWHRYARPTSFTIISKPNVMHHYIGIFLVISVLQVNMHTLITKKRLAIASLALHYA